MNPYASTQLLHASACLRDHDALGYVEAARRLVARAARRWFRRHRENDCARALAHVVAAVELIAMGGARYENEAAAIDALRRAQDELLRQVGVSCGE